MMMFFLPRRKKSPEILSSPGYSSAKQAENKRKTEDGGHSPSGEHRRSILVEEQKLRFPLTPFDTSG
jgi:hypothetical protein